MANAHSGTTVASPASSVSPVSPVTPAPLDAALAEIHRRWREAGIPDLYEGCLEPHGGPVSRERARNVRAVFYPKPPLPVGRVESLAIEGQPFGSDARVPIRITWPHAGGATASSAPAANTLVYFHGGGFVVGDLDSHDAHAIRLANEAGCVVVQVDYRLAPEHRFPAAYLDCLAATRWAHEHIQRLGGRPERLAIGGDSAGGNLAAAVALACRDSGVALAAQLLLYPVTDLSRMKGLPERAYLGDAHLEERARDPRASPQLATSHAGLAPVILGVGSHDFLYQDNMDYARRLHAAHVPLTLRQFADLNHGFFSYTTVSASCLAAA